MLPTHSLPCSRRCQLGPGVDSTQRLLKVWKLQGSLPSPSVEVCTCGCGTLVSASEAGAGASASTHQATSPVCPTANMCVRTDPAEDSTNGFFVALFVRQQRPAVQALNRPAQAHKTKKESRARAKRRSAQTSQAQARVPQQPLVVQTNKTKKAKRSKSKSAPHQRSVVASSSSM